MKNTLSKIFLIASALTLFIFWGCEKDLNVAAQLEFEPYSFTSLDENGGTWKPILLTSGSEIAVPAPLAATSPEYLAEVAATKSARAAITPDQEELVKYWGGNAISRWTQIASDIMAKYNLPPAPNADGTYPSPNSLTPDVYPYFPFANPPYASRAYSYWGAAEFDALVAAWHFKNEYKRAAPFKTDASISPVLPSNDLNTYPSEDAVIAAVSRTILTAMFPNEKALLEKLAEEHKNSRIWGGMNVASDLAAGDSLGRKVAAKFLARAKGDGMGKAGSQTLSDSMKNDAQSRYGQHWNSLETPARPGMLPLFGRLKMWNVAGGVASVRPPVPPKVGSAEFTRAADELKGYIDNASTENRRIANYWSDGVGTYTPPGHWAITAAKLVHKNKLNPLRSARVMAYMMTAVMDAGVSCWDTKYFYHYPRPAEAIPDFKTIIGVPNFPAYTSGHSTFSGAGAQVLAHFFPSEKSTLDAQAKEASESRIVSGIHYRFDCEVGLQVGKTIGDKAIEKAKLDGGE